MAEELARSIVAMSLGRENQQYEYKLGFYREALSGGAEWVFRTGTEQWVVSGNSISFEASSGWELAPLDDPRVAALYKSTPQQPGSKSYLVIRRAVTV